MTDQGGRTDALTELLRDISATETEIPVLSVAPLSDSGRVWIDGERIIYTSKTQGDPSYLNGCTRGADQEEGGTAARPHNGGDYVWQDNRVAASLTPTITNFTNAQHDHSDVAGGGQMLVVLPYTATPVTASTSSLVTYSTLLSFTTVLPAGTWEVTTLAWADLTNTVVSNGAQLRISAPIGSTFDPIDVSGVALDRVPFSNTSNGSVASDGVAATTFTSQFRAATGGTAFAQAASMLAICRKDA